MSLSDDPIHPTEPPQPSHEETTASQRLRRRRATRRSSIPTDAEGQAALISSLARRAYPSIELFVFSLVCGVILGLGFLFDSQAVLFLGVLVAPLMTPWVGFLLAILTGSIRFLFETVMALLISLALVFVGGLLTGFGTLIMPQIARDNLYIHSHIWLPALIVLGIGAVTLVASFARSEEKPFLPSVIIAFAFFLPVNAVGFSISAGIRDVWLQGLLVFLTHFALASILGLIALFILRLKPSLGGIIFSGLSLVLFAGILIVLMGSGSPSQNDAIASPTADPAPVTSPPLSLTPSLAATSTASPRPTATPTSRRTPTPTSGTASPIPLTLDVTLPPSETPTITLTIPPAPTYGRIAANEGGGANLRDAPGGTYVMTLLNGTIVETFSEFSEVNGVTWVKVYITLNGQQIEGWLLESVIAYATPAPNFEASATPTRTPTP
ncbi:MAG TPA: hypothetical protein DCY14_10120 [Anaerolineae bacterium]|nr:hypothetical protein [Anaerolineae bacterium]HRJ54810.1 DUF389 domain-containing protein [Anaerolineales bacterium]